MPRRRGVQVADASRWSLDLIVGPFTSLTRGLDADELDDALRVVWAQSCDQILADYRSGRRPWAWWQFEAGEVRPREREAELERLIELGEVDGAEAAMARREFQRKSVVSMAVGEI